MVKVAIAGGRGHLGATIAETLTDDSRHEYIVLSRGAPKNEKEVQVDYDDISAVTAVLEKHEIHTVISTMLVISEPAAKSETNLVKAAAASKFTERFVQSIWGAPAPAEAAAYMPHISLRQGVQDELRKTNLEWTQVHNGYFMDYYGLPHLKSHLAPPPFAIDVDNKAATIPGSGDDKMVFTYTYDVARFVAEVLTLPKWDEITTIVGDRVTLNEFVQLAEEARGTTVSSSMLYDTTLTTLPPGTKFNVVYDDMDKLKTFQTSELPSHASIYPYFPKEKLQYMFAAFGMWAVGGYFNLPEDKAINHKFPNIKPLSVKQMLETSWQNR
ncbi:hypothetical protein D6C86_03754 [Aureobasidium pullulans]|uniref:NmrA-like domain-containing protein n=1 Tax=Aureobasidium pullulans TaxID=5580 RepID=A0A4S9WEQ0_AURPU|nr:hypothetical protein D6C94_04116 [Aureobasidium pullulans]THZ47513.1 hypothetical protein D6C87_01396 [Aureobasidium pullulans]THZ62434.1 hypothetical protein D6C86_03754 [Aureobasidium pullulans]THZ64032.1 hypothetical protein D6C88_08448 [Aureobasidium pullulans]CAD0021147.1 unnamed protein product [Aureobasidium pullulans]